MDALIERFRALAAADPERNLFGANAHGWESFPIEIPDGPADFRRWLSEVGHGAGPFYGLLDPTGTEEQRSRPFPYTESTQDGAPGETPDGALRIADHGCGYYDLLVMNGPHQGEVWADFREGGGPMTRWYATFTDYLTAWLERSEAEWVQTCNDGVPEDAEADFIRAAQAAALRTLGGTADPMQAQYPLSRSMLSAGLGQVHLVFGEYDAAEARFAEAATASREPKARSALFRAILADRKDDHAAALAAADEGLAAGDGWFATETQLHVYRSEALELLGRLDEAVLAREALAAHASNDVQHQLTVVWIRLERGETELAIERTVKLLNDGVGCEAADPLDQRIQDLLHNGFAESLEENGVDATAFEAAVRARIAAAG